MVLVRAPGFFFVENFYVTGSACMRSILDDLLDENGP